MSRYVVSPRAAVDLAEIWDYTAKRWGTDQAEAYTRLLQRAMETVAEDPRRGRTCHDIRAGYHMYRAGSHMLLYRNIDLGIDIVRVLHSRMDFERHL